MSLDPGGICSKQDLEKEARGQPPVDQGRRPQEPILPLDCTGTRGQWLGPVTLWTGPLGHLYPTVESCEDPSSWPQPWLVKDKAELLEKQIVGDRGVCMSE